MKIDNILQHLRGGASLTLLRYLSTQPINSVWEGKSRARLRHYFLDGKSVPVSVTEYLPDGSDAEAVNVPFESGKSYLIEIKTRSVEKGNVTLTGSVFPEAVELAPSQAAPASGGSRKAA